jgi:hypothetical protein
LLQKAVHRLPEGTIITGRAFELSAATVAGGSFAQISSTIAANLLH